MRFAILAVRSLENGDEHRRNVLQEIFGLGVIEKFGVLLQLVRHLINNESPARRERIMGLLKQRALLVDLENAERDPRHNVIARIDFASPQLRLQMRGIIVKDMNARIVAELALQIARKRGIDLEQQ